MSRWLFFDPPPPGLGAVVDELRGVRLALERIAACMEREQPLALSNVPVRGGCAHDWYWTTGGKYCSRCGVHE